MSDTPAAPAAPPPRDDEFYGGIWWKRDGAEWRDATLGECATEIRRLRAENAELRAAVKELADAYEVELINRAARYSRFMDRDMEPVRRARELLK